MMIKRRAIFRKSAIKYRPFLPALLIQIFDTFDFDTFDTEQVSLESAEKLRSLL